MSYEKFITDFLNIEAQWLQNVFHLQKKIDLDNPPKYNKVMNRYMNLRDIRDMLFYEFPDLKIDYELKEYYVNLNAACKLQEAKKSHRWGNNHIF